MAWINIPPRGTTRIQPWQLLATYSIGTKCRLAVSLDVGWRCEIQWAFRVLFGRGGKSRSPVCLFSGSYPSLGLAEGTGSQLSCRSLCQPPDFWLSGMRAHRGRHVQSSAGSLHHIPPTLFLSRALIPGLCFPLIDYLCHCGAGILHRSPAWSLITGAWGMIIPQRHPSIIVNNSREGRQMIIGTCSTEVLLFLGQEASAEEEENLEGGWGGVLSLLMLFRAQQLERNIG